MTIQVHFAPMKIYNVPMKYKIGFRTVRATATISKNITVRPTRAIRAAAARKFAHAASKAIRRAGTSGTSGQLTVTGAGSVSFNGTYVANGTNNGQPLYILVGTPTIAIEFDGANWRMASGTGPYTAFYTSSGDASGPYSVGGLDLGVLPAPAASFGGSTASFGVQTVDLTGVNLPSHARLQSVRSGKYAACASNP